MRWNELIRLADQEVSFGKNSTSPDPEYFFRRAASSAYYAVFHRIASDFSEHFVLSSGNPKARILMGRSLQHTELANSFTSLVKWKNDDVVEVFRAFGYSGELRAGDFAELAIAFPALMKVRHFADYNFQDVFSETKASEQLAQAKNALGYLDAMNSAKCHEYLSFLHLILRKKVSLKARGD